MNGMQVYVASVQRQLLLFALRHLDWDLSMALPPYETSLQGRREIRDMLVIVNIIKSKIPTPALLPRVLGQCVPLRFIIHFGSYL